MILVIKMILMIYFKTQSNHLYHQNQVNHSSDVIIGEWVENQGYKNAKWRPKSDYFDDLYTCCLLDNQSDD